MKQLTLSLTYARIKTRYRNTFAGFLWVIAYPLLNFSIQVLVFSQILHTSLNANYYVLFLFLGYFPWFFLVQNIEMTFSFFEQYNHQIKYGILPPFRLFLSTILDNTMHFYFIFFAGLIVYSLNFRIDISKIAIIFPITVLYTLMVAALSWTIAVVQVFFKDTRFIMNFVFQIGYFITPIFYTEELAPPILRPWLWLNPIHRFISLFRAPYFEYFRIKAATDVLAILIITLLATMTSYWIWKKRKRELYANL